MSHKDVLKLLFPLELTGEFDEDIALEGQYLDAAQADAEQLLREMLPQSAGITIADWERVYGLIPAAADTLQIRQLRLIAKIRERGGLSIPYFTALAATMGYTVTIEELKNWTAGSGAVTLDLQVAASAGDVTVYWTGAAWAINLASAIQITGDLTGFTQYKNGGGMRFLYAPIPPGSIITTAYLVLTAFDNYSSTVVKSRITGDLEPNAAPFSTLADYQVRRGTDVGGANNSKRTVAQVTYDNTIAWIQNTAYNSPELKTVIQEIINQGSWALGNALALFWDDHEGRTGTNLVKGAWTYDGSPAKAAGLHIEFVLPLAFDMFRWRVTFTNIPYYYFRAGQSAAGERLIQGPLATALEGLFTDLKPAHTQIIFAYA